MSSDSMQQDFRTLHIHTERLLTIRFRVWRKNGRQVDHGLHISNHVLKIRWFCEITFDHRDTFNPFHVREIGLGKVESPNLST
jgi:hypothetical protein